MTEARQGAVATNLGEIPLQPQSVVVQEGLAAVRARPELYLGDADGNRFGVLVTCALRWAFAQDDWGDHAISATVTLTEDGGVCIDEDGNGLSVYEDCYGRVPLTHAFTALMTGPTSASGLSLITAFSHRVLVEVRREGYVWKQDFIGDVAASLIERLGRTSQSGTRITFWPKNEFFPEIKIAEFLRDSLSSYPRVSLNFTL